MHELIATLLPNTPMSILLTVCGLYVVVFGVDFLRYLHNKDKYNYVSWETWSLFALAQAVVIFVYFPVFKPFFEHFLSEMVFIAILTSFLFLFTYALMRDSLYVCYDSTRTLRCLSPAYVFVKGGEIVFQELCYLVIAYAITAILGLNIASYLAFVVILMLIHVVVILGGGQRVIKSLTLGLFLISVPIYYTFMEIGHIWPAIYLHSIMYVFYWLIFADFDVLSRKG